MEVLLVTSLDHQTLCPFVVCRHLEIAASELPDKVSGNDASDTLLADAAAAPIKKISES